MIVEKSFLDSNIIKKIMKDEYNIDTKEVKKINRGSANIYEVSTNQGKFILKEFQEKVKYKNVLLEFSVTDYLKSYNIETAEYVLTKNKKINVEYNNRIIIVQKFIKGEVINSNNSSKQQIIESIQLFANIVNALTNYPEKLTFFKRHIMTNELCEQDILNIDNLIRKTKSEKIKNKLIHKRKFLERLYNKDFSWIKKLTYKKSHGDYNVSQFIYDENGKIKAVLDFVSTRNMPLSREIIRNYFFMAKEIKEQKIDVEFFIEYVQEFMKYQKLNSYDLFYMPLLYLIELSRTIYGYEQYINSGRMDCLEYGDELYNQFICLEKNYYTLIRKIKKILKTLDKS